MTDLMRQEKTDRLYKVRHMGTALLNTVEELEVKFEKRGRRLDIVKRA